MLASADPEINWNCPVRLDKHKNPVVRIYLHSPKPTL